MEEESFGIREAFRREPEQTTFLIRFGLGGAFVIAVYSAIAGLFLNALIAQPVTLILSLIYGFVLVITTARLVSGAVGRRFVESALSSRTPHGMAVRALSEEQQAAASTVPVREQVSFNHAFFMLRVQEEVANARRDGHEMSVISIEATAPGMPMTADLAKRIANEFATLASGQHKTISQTLSVSESEYVMSLPHTDAAEAKAFVSKVVQALGNYWCHFGTAVYPVDGTTAEVLVQHARKTVEESREGRNSSRSPAVA
jgi:hypothetical protein